MNIMAKFKVIIKEELTRSVLVEAEDIAEAIEKTEEAYNNEEVVLNYNDYDGASFNAEEIEEYNQKYGLLNYNMDEEGE